MGYMPRPGSPMCPPVTTATMQTVSATSATTNTPSTISALTLRSMAARREGLFLDRQTVMQSLPTCTLRRPPTLKNLNRAGPLSACTCRAASSTACMCMYARRSVTCSATGQLHCPPCSKAQRAPCSKCSVYCISTPHWVRETARPNAPRPLCIRPSHAQAKPKRGIGLAEGKETGWGLAAMLCPQTKPH